MEIIIRIDPRDVSDVAQLVTMNRMGAFPPDALKLDGGDGPKQELQDVRGRYVYHVEVEGEPARYLLGLLADALEGAEPLAEYQRRKGHQVELDLDLKSGPA